MIGIACLNMRLEIILLHSYMLLRHKSYQNWQQMCIRKQELCGLVPYAQDILGTSDRA